mmetsp:Transcript_14680/g.31854  ORF Transcript_14680/g.31854 Transcript_14680/m.31854 type:complete len:441 (-) Transcript_14680:723-2045(-)
MSGGREEGQQQEIELNLRLDSDGRTTFDPSTCLQDGTTSAAVGSSDTESTRTCIVDYSCKTVLSHLASSDGKEDMEDDLLYDCEIADCGLLPRTFWMPAKGMKPRCRLEQMAVEVFNQHVPGGYTYDSATSGAEWWVQIRPSPPLSGRYSMHADKDEHDHGQDQDMAKTGISFHWDKDEDLRLAMGGSMYLHPHLSTVTYLTDIGAPTMVVSCRVNNFSGEYIASGDSTEGYVSWPRKGKHLSFDGRYLHAAPGDLMERGEFDKQCKIDASSIADDHELQKLKRRHRRVTFLVNVWLNYKPFNVDSFPETMIDKMSVQKESSQQPILFDSIEQSCMSRCGDSSVVIGRNRAAAGNDEKSHVNQDFTWPIGMGGCGSNERIRMTMPLYAIRNEKKQGGNVHIEWAHDSSGVAILKDEENQLSAVEPETKSAITCKRQKIES